MEVHIIKVILQSRDIPTLKDKDIETYSGSGRI
jgi:hypothetical protein